MDAMAAESLASKARELMERERTGTLSTMSARHRGYPFGSLMPYSVDAKGNPVFLLSALAIHTRNLIAEPRASLLIAETIAPGEDSAAERVTLLGEVWRLEDSEASDVRDAYIARHPEARQWVDFGDFGFWRMIVREIYYVGGYGVMGWVATEEFSAV